MTQNNFQAAASNNPVAAGQVNQFLVDHNIQIYAYDGTSSVSNLAAQTATYGTNTGVLPQMIAQAFTVGGSNITMSRLELILSAATSTGGASGAAVNVSIQTNNSGVPSGTIVCQAYIPASWLTTTAQVISIPMTAALTASTEYWIVIGSSTGTTNYTKVSSGGSTTVAKTSTNGGVTWSSGATELYFNLHTNANNGLLRGIQADSSAFQQAFNYGVCTVSAAMNGDATTTATWTVDGGTQGFPSSGTFFVPRLSQTITYSAKTATTFTYSSGGSAATLLTGDLIYATGIGFQPTNLYEFTAYQSTVLGNLIVPPDDSFENGVGSWAGGTNSPTVAQSSAQSLFGSASMLVTMTAGAASTVQTGSYFAVTSGQSYAFQAFVLAGSAHLRNVNMAVAYYNSSGSQVGSTVTGTAVATSQTVWANPQLATTVPTSGSIVNAQIILQFGLIATSNLGDTYYVDGVGMTNTVAVPTWSPGGLGQGQTRALTYSSGSLVSMA